MYSSCQAQLQWLTLFVLQDEQKHLRRRSMEVMETVKKRRSTELYSKWKVHRQELEKEVEEKSKEVEESWKVQGRKGWLIFVVFTSFTVFCGSRPQSWKAQGRKGWLIFFVFTSVTVFCGSKPQAWKEQGRKGWLILNV